MAGNQSSSTYSSHPNVMQRERKRIPEIPPGFYFNPTDEDLIENYVRPYNSWGNQLPLPNDITIPYADVYTSHPTDLPRDFQYGIDDEFYCFTQWKPKKRGGSRINRQVDMGVARISWETNERESEIWKTNKRESKFSRIGFKKTFYFSEVKPGGKGTRWIMHEFSLHSSSQNNGKVEFEHYVLCKITPPSRDFPGDMIKELTLSSIPICIEKETATTSNSNKAIRGNEDISRGFMDENYQPPVLSLHQSDNLYNSTIAMTSEGTWHPLMMAVEQGITGDGLWASSHDETESAAISNNVVVPLEGVKADILEDLMTLDYQKHYSSLQWKGEDTREDYPSFYQYSNMGWSN